MMRMRPMTHLAWAMPVEGLSTSSTSLATVTGGEAVAPPPPGSRRSRMRRNWYTTHARDHTWGKGHAMRMPTLCVTVQTAWLYQCAKLCMTPNRKLALELSMCGFGSPWQVVNSQQNNEIVEPGRGCVQSWGPMRAAGCICIPPVILPTRGDQVGLWALQPPRLQGWKVRVSTAAPCPCSRGNDFRPITYPSAGLVL